MHLPWLACIVCRTFLTILWFPFPLWLALLRDWALLDHGLYFSSAHPFSCYPLLPYHSIIPAAKLFASILLGLFRPAIYSSPNGPVRPLVLLLHHRWAPVSHSFSLGRPRPVCFPWASSALFLTSHYHGLLLNSLGFPGPITLFLILEVHGLAINPLLSLFSLLWTCCGPFSLFHIIHCLWFAFSLFPSSFKPIYLLKIYFFISWVCDPLFPLLGLNGCSSQFTNFFFSHISGLLLAIGPPYQSGHQHYPHSKGLSMMMMCAPFSSSSFPFLFLGNFLWSWTSTLVPISLCLQQFLYLFLHVFAVTRTHFFAFGGQILFFFFFCFHRICRHFLLQYMHLFLYINATLTLLLLEQHLYCRKWRLW